MVEKTLRGKLIADAPLAKYLSWRTGGVAKQLYQPADINDLGDLGATAIEACSKRPAN